MRIVVVALMTLSLALAGCADESFVPEEPEPCVVVDPTDTQCLEADELANKTADEVAHQHDYWNGRETVSFMEDVEMEMRGSYSWCEGPMPFEPMLPPDGAVVFQGTGLMDIRLGIELGENHNTGTLELWIKRADDFKEQYVAEWTDGAEIQIEVAEEEADLPHQVLSAWEFWLYAHQSAPDATGNECNVDLDGLLSISADITKTREPPVFPGHPDHWGDEDELHILDAWAVITYGGSPGGDGDPDSGGCLQPGSNDSSGHRGVGACDMWWLGFGTDNGTIVPPESGTFYLTLDSTADEDDAPGQELGLTYHGADTREFTKVEPVRVEGDVKFYEIGIERHEMDGPYARQSQWQFKMVVESPTAVYSGTFSLTGYVERE